MWCQQLPKHADQLSDAISQQPQKKETDSSSSMSLVDEIPNVIDIDYTSDSDYPSTEESRNSGFSEGTTVNFSVNLSRQGVSSKAFRQGKEKYKALFIKQIF